MARACWRRKAGSRRRRLRQGQDSQFGEKQAFVGFLEHLLKRQSAPEVKPEAQAQAQANFAGQTKLKLVVDTLGTRCDASRGDG